MILKTEYLTVTYNLNKNGRGKYLQEELMNIDQKNIK